MVQTLLDNGANIDAMDSEDRTLLMKFVEQGNLEAAKTLLDKGADVDAANPPQTTALMPLQP